MNVMIPGHADATVQVQTVANDLCPEAPTVTLGDADSDCRIRSAVLNGLGGVGDCSARSLELGGMVGQTMLHSLKRANRPAKGDTLLDVVERQLEGPIDDTHGLGTMQDECNLKLVLHLAHRAIELTYERLLQDAYLLESHVRQSPAKIDALEAINGNTASRHRQKKLRHTPIARRRYQKLVGDTSVLNIRGRAVEHEPLA